MKNHWLKYSPIVVIWFTLGCGKPKPLEYLAIQNFKVNAVGLSKSVISADVYYYNPNAFRMQLKRAEMDVTVNDKYMGHSTLDTLMPIPRLDTFSIPVHMEVEMKSLISNSFSALFGNEVDLKLEGKARLGKGGIFFNFPFSYQGKQKFKLF
jgi:LEA14-like dessication related protein